MMKPNKSPSVEEFKVIGQFESLRRILLTEKYAHHLDKSLAYWALPTDRRLPLAFLGRTLRDLLSTPFADLAATQGIGEKKIHSLVKLLARAAQTDPVDLPLQPAPVSRDNPRGVAATNGETFDPDTVSELAWARLQADVARHGLGEQKLGLFAPSLKSLTRVIWNSPLSQYTNRTLAEIRSLKTHGEKRVRAIVEVFHSVATLVAGMGTQDHLVVRIVPRNIDAVEAWIAAALAAPDVPTENEILQRFIQPLLEQIRTDATDQIAGLAENRLGLDGPITSVRQVAREMGLTRARVYQLLNEINDVMTVRWPSGRRQVYELRSKFEYEIAARKSQPRLEQFYAAIELFYPGGRRGADGPMEHAFKPADFDGHEEQPAEATSEAVGS